MDYDFEMQAEYLIQRILKLIDESGKGYKAEIDWLNDGFYITNASGVVYSLHKNLESKEIVVSSPIIGNSAFRFDPHTEEWHKSDGTILTMMLQSELFLKEIA
jgi:frataxin-like iron-binding protein CyaY